MGYDKPGKGVINERQYNTAKPECLEHLQHMIRKSGHYFEIIKIKIVKASLDHYGNNNSPGEIKG
jgi:hypothetical protein